MPQQPPPDWGVDTLSEFLEQAHENRYATFHNKRRPYALLARIDACFAAVATGWLDPSNLISPLLFLRCHAAYRAACEHALAGQAAETFTLIRSCLECAGYALHIHNNPGFDLNWLNRHDNDQTMKSTKSAFLVSKVRATIEKADPPTAKLFDLFYQRAIDFGAHPNERSVTGNLVMIERNGGQEFQLIYLHGDSLSLDHGLKSTAEAGLCALIILQHAFAERFFTVQGDKEIEQIKKFL